MEPTVELLQGDLEPFVVIQYADHQRRMTVQQAHQWLEDARSGKDFASKMRFVNQKCVCLYCKVSDVLDGIR